MNLVLLEWMRCGIPHPAGSPEISTGDTTNSPRFCEKNTHEEQTVQAKNIAKRATNKNITPIATDTHFYHRRKKRSAQLGPPVPVGGARRGGHMATIGQVTYTK